MVNIRYDAPSQMGPGRRMGVGQLREGSKVIFRITSRRVTMLLASLALLLGIPAAAGAASSSAATSIGWISLGNLSSTPSPVDVYVYSSSDSSPMIVLHDVAYGFVSDFRPLTPAITA